MLRILLKLQDQLVSALAICAAATALLMLYLTVGDVVSRTLGFGSWPSTMPVVELSLLYFAIFSAPYLVRRKAHVAIDSFIRLTPPAVRKLALYTVLWFSALACLTCGIISIGMLEDSVASGEMVISSIDLPFWLFALPLPIGYVATAIEFLRLAAAGTDIYSQESGGSI